MVKQIIGILNILLLFAADMHAQQSTRLQQGWEFLKQDLGGVWEAVRLAEKGSPESVPIWSKVVLPHCVNATDAVDPDINYYQGPSWYRTSIAISNPYKQGRTLLHFEGAGQKTDVYVYTTKVGSHTGGYDEWTVDITEAVDSFKNNPVYSKQFNNEVPVIIRTDNSRDLEMIPSGLSDFTIYGGIYRHLNLTYAPPLSIDKIFAEPVLEPNGKMASLKVRGRFYNPYGSTSAQVNVKVIDPLGKLVAELNQPVNVTTLDIELLNTTIKNPVLWSPDKPVLYTLEVVAKQGGYEAMHHEKIGFRNIKFVQNGPFMINGNRLLLRGTHRHEDHAGVGAAITDEMMQTELALMKDMGVNFIRLGHYQQSRRVLDLCDSLGILVWEEIPWCRGGLGGAVYREQAKRMLTNMIEQHYNHTSVIIWGLGNENDWPGDFPEFDQSAIRAFMKELDGLAHTLDSSRQTAIRRCDFCKDLVDVYSPSIWAGWYRGIYTEYKTISQQEAAKVNHFLHAEWGGDSHAGRHSEQPDAALQKINWGEGADEKNGDASLFGGAARVSKDGDWSESYIVNLFDWHLKEQETMPWLSGTAQWVFKDFATPIRPENPVPYVNQKGVVERDFTKKESYYVFQSYWTQKPMVHIYGHSWPVRWGIANERKLIKVFSNCTEAELWVNGKSLGKKQRNSQDFPAAGLRWEALLQHGKNNIEVKAWKNGIVVQDSISLMYETEKWGKPTQIRLQKEKEENGIITLEAKLFDDKGIQCLDAAQFVRFGLTGDGNLLDNMGTASGSRYVQLQNGRATIKVLSNNGKSVVSVQSEGIPTSFINL